jgi:hypothetical protein
MVRYSDRFIEGHRSAEKSTQSAELIDETPGIFSAFHESRRGFARATEEFMTSLGVLEIVPFL